LRCRLLEIPEGKNSGEDIDVDALAEDIDVSI
jgi:hypothetical protein